MVRLIMSSVISAIVTIIFASSTVCAAEVNLIWDPPEAAIPIGYRMYQGTQSGVYDKNVDTGPTTAATMQGLAPNVTYYWAVTALYPDGSESGFSNEVSKFIPQMEQPGGLRIIENPQ